jgi:hypothetical protein
LIEIRGCRRKNDSRRGSLGQDAYRPKGLLIH